MLLRTLRITLFCTISCILWVARVGNVLRRCTASRSVKSYSSLPQSFAQDVRGRHCVLNRKINSHASDRGHGMRGIADAQQSGAEPSAQAIDCDRE